MPQQQAMVPAADVLENLDAQCADYQAMYREGIQQRDCLRQDDLKGLSAASERMRSLMDRVRVRQSRIPADLATLEHQRPEVDERTDALRRLMRSVMEVRDQSEEAARALLDDTRRQLRQFDTGRRASHRYRPATVHKARFIDGTQ